MTVRKGTYVLAITLGADVEMDVGALGTLFFPKGLYCYVGSAMGGLDQRLSRHLSREKRIRWHIDRLTMVADSVEAFESYPDWIPECELASRAIESGMTPFIMGFGCSDCRCATHLFKGSEESLDGIVNGLGLTPWHQEQI